MEIVFVWFVLAVIVGIAGNTRGRSGFGWFLLAVVISPLLAGLLVLALPSLHSPAPITNQADASGPLRIEKRGSAPPRPVAAPPITAPATAPEDPFIPDGVYAGIPYRARPDGSLDAMMPGGLVRFRTTEQFVAAATGKTTEPSHRAG